MRSRWAQVVILLECTYVASLVALGHTNDCPVERHVAVVIRAVLPDVTRELRNLDFRLELLLEASVQHLALGRLEPVEDVGDGSAVVVLGEEDELPVDEVRVVHSVVLRVAVVQECILLDVVEPPLPVLDLTLGEGHVDKAGACGDDAIVVCEVFHIVVAAEYVGAELVEVNFVNV